MIEVIYSGETREPKVQEKGILSALKNIRQIGNAGKTTRIYVEDCVMGFLERQMEKKDPVIAALLGKESQENGITYLFINGALLPNEIKVKGETLEFSSQAFLTLYEEAEKYFPKSEILGWYLPAYEMIGKYGASLGQNSKVFLLEDPTESEEIFYLWEQNHLSKQGGYYIYYQRNDEMKNYMQNQKEKIEENGEKKKTWAVVQGREESSLRKREESIQKEKAESKKKFGKEPFVDDYEELDKSGIFEMSQPKLTTFLYGASTVLAIVVLVIGITLVNNYDKMYEMQEAIETIAKTVTEVQTVQEDNEKDGETNGSIDSNAQESLSGEEGQKGSTEVQQQQEESDVNKSVGQDTTSETQGEAETVAQSGHRYYIIQEGDTLASISRKMYQTTDKIDEIKQLNEGIKENELIVGQKIILP